MERSGRGSVPDLKNGHLPRCSSPLRNVPLEREAAVLPASRKTGASRAAGDPDTLYGSVISRGAADLFKEGHPPHKYRRRSI